MSYANLGLDLNCNKKTLQRARFLLICLERELFHGRVVTMLTLFDSKNQLILKELRQFVNNI